MTFTLESPAFAAGEWIPELYTCEGSDLPPPLYWSGAPAGTAAFLLTCDDPDAPRGTFHHWAVWNIPAEATGIDAETAAHLPQGRNDFGRVGYGGPCPPRGHPPHRYVFRLSALSARLGVPAGTPCLAVQRAALQLVLATAELIGLFGR